MTIAEKSVNVSWYVVHSGWNWHDSASPTSSDLCSIMLGGATAVLFAVVLILSTGFGCRWWKMRGTQQIYDIMQVIYNVQQLKYSRNIHCLFAVTEL